MKRLILLILGLAGLLALAGCGTTDPNALGSISGYVRYEQVASGDATGFKGVRPASKLTVVDNTTPISTTSAPVSGASVVMDGTVFATTNSSGYFKFSEVKGGPHHIVISHPEYRDTLYTDVDLKPGENKRLYEAHMAQAYNVVVGIGDYKDNKYQSDLNAPPNDASNMKSALESTFHSTTKVIRDWDATRSAILDAINTAVKTVNRNYDDYGEKDYLFFYFSGHGGTDGNYDFIRTTEGYDITDKELRDAFDQLDPSLKSRVVVILDSCDSGNFFDGDYAGKSLTVNPPMTKALLGSGINVMSASSVDQEANDGDQMSEFTQYLVAGLDYDVQGADANTPPDHEITVGELFDYARNAVVQDTINDSSKVYQTPAATFADPDLVLIRY